MSLEGVNKLIPDKMSSLNKMIPPMESPGGGGGGTVTPLGLWTNIEI